MDRSRRPVSKTGLGLVVGGIDAKILTIYCFIRCTLNEGGRGDGGGVGTKGGGGGGRIQLDFVYFFQSTIETGLGMIVGGLW